MRCSFEGCTNKARSKRLCTSHLSQQSAGETLYPLKSHQTPLERFQSHVVIDPDSGCWNFVGDGRGSGRAAKDGAGYGQLRHGGKRQMAHRFAYEHFVGTIAEGDQIDHTCRNKKCCNPDHLEAVSGYENMRRLRFAQVLQARIDELERQLEDCRCGW
jgi:hypothetical protein